MTAITFRATAVGWAMLVAFSPCADAQVPKSTNTPASATPAGSGVVEKLRDARYCEVISVARTKLTFTVKVFNTIGFNACPADQWAALNEAAVAKQLGVERVKLNGPRYWVLDAIEGRGVSATAETADFGGVKMGLRATISTKLWQGTVGEKFYSPNQVRRETTWHYKAGAPVFELSSPTGEVYMMQSYAQIIDKTLSMADLARLGERLKLPKGWKYQTRVLAADYALTANGLAYVINDDLYNSYQRRPK